MLRRNIKIALACLAVSACSATGTQVKPAQLAQFHKGSTTVADVTSALGPANQSLLDDAGRQTLCYVYAEVTARPESFIPYVGAFAGGADVHNNSTCFTFSQAGVLASYTSTSGQSGSGYGLESGTTTSRVQNEPHQAQ